MNCFFTLGVINLIDYKSVCALMWNISANRTKSSAQGSCACHVPELERNLCVLFEKLKVVEIANSETNLGVVWGRGWESGLGVVDGLICLQCTFGALPKGISHNEQQLNLRVCTVKSVCPERTNATHQCDICADLCARVSSVLWLGVSTLHRAQFCTSAPQWWAST